MIFAAGALVSRIGIGSRGGRWRWFAPAAASFALAAAWGPRNSVVLLALFAIPTVAAGAQRSRAFPVFAASDLVLVLAITERQGGTGLWNAPAAGGWGDGAVLAAIAAALRLLGGGWREPDGARLVGWWQGAFLAWWVGASAHPLLLATGLAVIVVAGLMVAGRTLPGLLLGGGVLLAVASFPGPPKTTALVLAAVGFSGAALALGEKVAAAFVLTAAPLSPVWRSLEGWKADPLLASLVVPLAFVAIARAVLAAPSSGGGRLPAWAAVVSASRVLTPALTAWSVFGSGAAGAVATFASRPSTALPDAGGEASRAPGSIEHAVAGWLLLGLAAAAWARLVLIGAGTGFL